MEISLQPLGFMEFLQNNNQLAVKKMKRSGRTHKRCTLMDPHTWPCKSRTTSTNIYPM